MVALFRRRRGRSGPRGRRRVAALERTPGLELLEGRTLLSITVTGDFNCDGFADLAIGVPGENIEITVDAGAVNVLYGTSPTTGLTTTRAQFWSQNTAGVLDGSAMSDQFGSALATGDFNRDGRDDLAIGVPFEDIGIIINIMLNAGAVNVLYGGNAGLTATGNQFWHQDVPGVLNVAEAGDRFGAALGRRRRA